MTNTSSLAGTHDGAEHATQDDARAPSGLAKTALASSFKRTEPSLVRFTSEEFRAVSARARECGLPLARFIREVALGAVPKARRSAANSDVIRELSRIGTALRRMADSVRDRNNDAGHEHDASAIDAVITEVLDTIRRVE